MPGANTRRGGRRQKSGMSTLFLFWLCWAVQAGWQRQLDWSPLISSRGGGRSKRRKEATERRARPGRQPAPAGSRRSNNHKKVVPNQGKKRGRHWETSFVLISEARLLLRQDAHVRLLLAVRRRRRWVRLGSFAGGVPLLPWNITFIHGWGIAQFFHSPS